MRRERNTGVQPPLECLDPQGKEIVPGHVVQQAFDLGPILAQELEYPVQAGEAADEAIRTMVISTSHVYDDLESYRGSVVARSRTDLVRQQGVRSKGMAQLATRASSKATLYPPALTKTLLGLAPEELNYFRKALQQNEGTVIEEDLINAGAVIQDDADEAQSPRRLAANNAETHAEWVQIIENATSVMLLEDQALASAVLNDYIAVGDARQMQAAAGMLEEIRAIAHNSDAGKLVQLRDYAEMRLKITELADSIAICYLTDAAVERGIRNRAKAYEGMSAGNLNLSLALIHLLYAREFRMNGNARPDDRDLPFIVRASLSEPSPAPIEELSQVAEALEQAALKQQYTEWLGGILVEQETSRPDLLPAKEIKRRQLDEARAALVRGYNLGDGSQVDGISKTDSQRYISDIEHIRELIQGAKTPLEAKDKLGKAVSDSDSLIAAIETGLTQADSELDSIFAEDLKRQAAGSWSLSESVQGLKSNWKQVSFLIKNYWPEGKAFAEQLGGALFTSTAETQEAASISHS